LDESCRYDKRFETDESFNVESWLDRYDLRRHNMSEDEVAESKRLTSVVWDKQGLLDAEASEMLHKIVDCKSTNGMWS
jgi:hypothetical protein